MKQHQPYATNAGLILSAGQICLIDPGLSEKNLTEIKQFIRDNNGRVTTLILTHAHWDHLLGASHFPDARILASKSYKAIIDRYKPHLCQQVLDWRARAHDPYLGEWEPPAPAMTFSYELVVTVGELDLWLLATPGHTADHSSLYCPQDGVLWAGDMLSDSEGPFVEDVSDYADSLAKMQSLGARMVIPGHGTPAVNKSEIRKRFDQDQRYVRELHTCVLACVSGGLPLEQTINHCMTIEFAQPDHYPNARLWNIESAYRTLGGVIASPTGWEKEWLTEH